jgi:hypothetical protein
MEERTMPQTFTRLGEPRKKTAREGERSLRALLPALGDIPAAFDLPVSCPECGESAEDFESIFHERWCHYGDEQFRLEDL